MLYSEIIAVCSQIHTKHINTLRGQNIESLNVRLVVRIVTTGLYLKDLSSNFMSVKNSPPTDPNPSLMNAPHSNVPCSFIVHFNITFTSILGSRKGFPLASFARNILYDSAPAYGLVAW